MIKLKEGQKVLDEQGNVYLIERGDIVRFTENDVDLAQIVSTVDLSPLEKAIERVTGLRGITLEITDIRKNKYISISDPTNYAKQAGCLATSFESLHLVSFGSQADEEEWWLSIHWSYQFSAQGGRGSNGHEILNATYSFKAGDWKFIFR